jgi:periplasmic divalent cation tolerance protein
MENVRVVNVTIPMEKADEMGRAIVEKRMAACVNIIPGLSSYYWSGNQIKAAAEAMLVIKTTPAKLDELVAFVKEHHPYDVPELITIPIAEGSPDYVSWVIDEMGKK